MKTGVISVKIKLRNRYYCVREEIRISCVAEHAGRINGENEMTEMRKGILAVSFGTSYEKAREKTLDRIEEDMRLRYPDRPLYRAWTSKIIREKIRQRDGIEIDDVSGALEKMAADGIHDVLVQPTFVISGHEYELMLKEVRSRRHLFARISVGSPLLTLNDDKIHVIEILVKELVPKRDEALVLMGHGSDHHANSVYASMGREFKNLGYPNVFVGTVEGTPTLGTVMRNLKKTNLKSVTLAPFMMVAGDHALNDLAGENENSWKNRFEEEGYPVKCILKGLGEYEGIRELLIEHMQRAEEI